MSTGVSTYVLLAAVSPLIAAAIPAVITSSRKEVPRWISYGLLGISSGMLFAVATLDLIPEGITAAAEQTHEEWNEDFLADLSSNEEAAHEHGEHNVKIATFGMFMGFLTMLVIQQVMSFFGAHSHSHGGHEEDGDHSHKANDTGAILSTAFSFAALVGLSVHSFVDGVMIGGAFSANANVGSRVGIAIVLHKFPDGFMLSSILQSVKPAATPGRRSPYFFQTKEFYWLLGICAMTPLGAIVSYQLLEGMPGIGLGFVLCFGAGTFLFIVCCGVIPELLHQENKALTVGSIALGYFAFLITDTLFHAH